MGILNPFSWFRSSKKKRKPGYGVVQYFPLIGETEKQYLARIKKDLVHLSSREEKAIRSALKKKIFHIKANVDQTVFEKYCNKPVGCRPVVSNECCGGEIYVGGGRGTDGTCCGGLQTGRLPDKKSTLNYYILEFLGEAEWPDNEDDSDDFW